MAKYKKSYKNNEFKISALTWNEEFELPDGSYSVSDIQKYFDHMLKKHGEKTWRRTGERTDNSKIMIYIYMYMYIYIYIYIFIYKYYRK